MQYVSLDDKQPNNIAECDVAARMFFSDTSLYLVLTFLLTASIVSMCMVAAFRGTQIMGFGVLIPPGDM